MALDPVTAALDLGSTLIDKLFPDKEKAAAARMELFLAAQKGELAELTTRMSAITAEAQSGNWLAAAWRPVTMLTFTGLIVARWFGFSAEGISEAEMLELWSIVKLGLGGYVVGRSAEKIVKEVAPVLRK